MSSSIEKVLAEVDDPKAIRAILREQNTARSETARDDSAVETQLSDLYERYLSRRQDRSPSTRTQYKRAIPDFVDFAHGEGITTAAGLSPRLIDRYIDELLRSYDRDATILTYTKNVRAWLKWVEKRGLCGKEVYQLLDRGELGLTPKARDEAMSKSETETILDNLRHRRRGTVQHAVTELLVDAGPRIGGLRGLDRTDLDIENREIHLRHRPESGTPLKNGIRTQNAQSGGERYVGLAESTVEALQLYLETSRIEVTDEYGREPLFTTSQGRATRSTLRRWVYEATSCRWAEQDTQDVSCDGSCDPGSDVCDYSYYPHALRRTAIVHFLSGDLPIDRVSERFDVSPKVIRRHYDPRSKRRRKQDRSDQVESARPDYD